jgi:hypothetical protein
MRLPFAVRGQMIWQIPVISSAYATPSRMVMENHSNGVAAIINQIAQSKRLNHPCTNRHFFHSIPLAQEVTLTGPAEMIRGTGYSAFGFRSRQVRNCVASPAYLGFFARAQELKRF